VTPPPPPAIVFVCEHGSVKSLIARQWFERMAAQRRLAARAESRGLTPDSAVPPPIMERLRADGFDVTAFRPRALAPSDLEGVARLVLIGVEAPPWAARPGRVVEKWEGVPPASEDYEAARDELKRRIEGLLAGWPRGVPKR
jgi:protein-tyrosine-phosphatase